MDNEACDHAIEKLVPLEDPKPGEAQAVQCVACGQKSLLGKPDQLFRFEKIQ